MARRRRFRRRRPESDETSLQITSMADIFMILLVFLLKTYSVSITSVSPSDNVTLPEAKALDQLKESTKVEISSNLILVDDQPVTTLTNFQIDPRDLEKDNTPRSLNTVLIREKQRALASAPEGEAPPVLLMADQRTPYTTIKAVLDAAGNSGFGDLKLVVVEAQ